MSIIYSPNGEEEFRTYLESLPEERRGEARKSFNEMTKRSFSVQDKIFALLDSLEPLDRHPGIVTQAFISMLMNIFSGDYFTNTELDKIIKEMMATVQAERKKKGGQ